MSELSVRARRRLRLLAGQAVLLVGLLAIAVVDETVLSLVVALVLVISVPFFGIVAWQLDRLSDRAPDIETLAERADESLAKFVESILLGIVGGIVLLRIAGAIPNILEVLGFGIRAGSILIVGLAFVLLDRVYPALRWLYIARDVWLPIIQRRESEAD